MRLIYFIFLLTGYLNFSANDNTVIQIIEKKDYSFSIKQKKQYIQNIKGLIDKTEMFEGELCRLNDSYFMKAGDLINIQEDSFFVSLDADFTGGFIVQKYKLGLSAMPLSLDPYDIIKNADSLSSEKLIQKTGNKTRWSYSFHSESPMKSLFIEYYTSVDSTNYLLIELKYSQRIGWLKEELFYTINENSKMACLNQVEKYIDFKAKKEGRSYLKNKTRYILFHDFTGSK